LGHAPHVQRAEFVETSLPKAAREVAFSEIVEQLPTGVDARGVERPVQGSVTSPAPRQRSTPASWDFIAAYPMPSRTLHRSRTGRRRTSSAPRTGVRAGDPVVSEDDQVHLVIGERQAAGVALLQHGSDMGAHEPAHRAREVVQGYFQGRAGAGAVRRRVRSRWPGSRPESLTAPGEENPDRVRTAQASLTHRRYALSTCRTRAGVFTFVRSRRS